MAPMIRHVIRYESNMHHQGLSLSRSQSRNPLKGAWLTWKRQDEEKEKDPRLIRAAPSIQTLGISEETRQTAGEEQVCGLRVQDPDPCGWGETHTVSRPCTWANTPTVSKVPPPPQILPLGSPDPWLGHHQVSAGPLKWKQVGTSNLLGWQKEVGPVSSPHTCPREVLLFSLWFHVILTVFTAVTIMLNTLPWFWQAWFFLVSLRCWENMPDAGLGDEGQVCSLRSRDSWPEGDHSSDLTSCPLAFCLIRVPCNQLTRWTCLPSCHAHPSESRCLRGRHLSQG